MSNAKALHDTGNGWDAGFRGRVSRSTLADANRVHDWRSYADFVQVLIRRARRWYTNEPLAVELKQTVYALDSTTSDNTVKTQVWIAISVYMLVAIVKKELGIDRSHSEILQILSVNLFEKTPTFTALTQPTAPIPDPTFPNQRTLFDL